MQPFIDDPNDIQGSSSVDGECVRNGRRRKDYHGKRNTLRILVWVLWNEIKSRRHPCRVPSPQADCRDPIDSAVQRKDVQRDREWTTNLTVPFLPEYLPAVRGGEGIWATVSNNFYIEDVFRAVALTVDPSRMAPKAAWTVQWEAMYVNATVSWEFGKIFYSASIPTIRPL